MIYFIQIDRLYEWKANRHKDVQDVIESQMPNTKMEFDKRAQEVRKHPSIFSCAFCLNSIFRL